MKWVLPVLCQLIQGLMAAFDKAFTRDKTIGLLNISPQIRAAEKLGMIQP